MNERDPEAELREAFHRMSDGELLHEKSQWRDGSPRRILAEQELHRREVDREEANFQKVSKQNSTILFWAKVAAGIAIVGAIASIVQAYFAAKGH